MRKHWIAVVVLLVATTTFTTITRAQVNRDINSYVLFAYDQLVFKGGDTNAGWGHIVGGNIGVNYPGMSGLDLAFATSGSAIMSDGSQAVADSVRADAGGSFYDLYANSLNLSFAATIRHGGTNITYTPTPIIPTGLLPVLPFTPGRALTDTAGSLTVATGGSFTFTAGTPYQDVRINDNATVTFGAGTFDIRNLSIGMNVTVIVDDNTILQIDQKFDPNNGLKFGLGTSSGAHVYVGAFGLSLTTAAIAFSSGAEVHGQFFSPTGFLNLGGESQLYGHYWAEVIKGDANVNVTFVPEPGTFALVGMSLVGLISIVSRRMARTANRRS